MRYLAVVIVLGAILLTSSFGINSAYATTRTTISLDQLPIYSVTQGDTIIFSGRLVNAVTVGGVVNATVKIIQDVSFDNRRVLATGMTDDEGYYSIPWVVDVQKVQPVTGGSYGTEPSQGARDTRTTIKVFAQFDGDDQFARSVSNAQSFEIRFSQLRIFVDRKPTYFAYENVIIRIRVGDVSGNPIEPDRIVATFDNRPLQLVRDGVGSYSFTITSLPPGQHSLRITAEKVGHVSDEQRLSLDAMKRRTSLAIETDKTTYQQGETVTVTASVLDASTNRFVPNAVVTASVASPDRRVVSLTLVEGKATHRLLAIDTVGTWSINANFAGDSAYFSSFGLTSFTVERATIVTPPPPRVEEKVSLGSVQLVDQQGNRLRNVSMGQQVMIQAAVTSNFDTNEEITYISQVKNADGVTVSLSWIRSTLSPGQTLELAISWLPSEAGQYTAEVFVWKDIREPEPLSLGVKRSVISVR